MNDNTTLLHIWTTNQYERIESAKNSIIFHIKYNQDHYWVMPHTTKFKWYHDRDTSRPPGVGSLSGTMVYTLRSSKANGASLSATGHMAAELPETEESLSSR
jgi:hypothetical protein